jgi:D-serine deaminase-like pyridoxal phosphate-dependent protein
MLNDQHAFVSLDASDSVAVSDWVGCGISHPCSVFDRWRVLTVVDGTSVVDFVTTVF